MAELDLLFAERIATLEQAQRAVEANVGQLLKAESLDGQALTRLSVAVRSLADQADALFLMMLNRDAVGPRMDAIEALVDFFHDVQERLDRRLRLDRE